MHVFSSISSKHRKSVRYPIVTNNEMTQLSLCNYRINEFYIWMLLEHSGESDDIKCTCIHYNSLLIDKQVLFLANLFTSAINHEVFFHARQ